MKALAKKSTANQRNDITGNIMFINHNIQWLTMQLLPLKSAKSYSSSRSSSKVIYLGANRKCNAILVPFSRYWRI